MESTALRSALSGHLLYGQFTDFVVLAVLATILMFFGAWRSRRLRFSPWPRPRSEEAHDQVLRGIDAASMDAVAQSSVAGVSEAHSPSRHQARPAAFVPGSGTCPWRFCWAPCSMGTSCIESILRVARLWPQSGRVVLAGPTEWNAKHLGLHPAARFGIQSGMEYRLLGGSGPQGFGAFFWHRHVWRGYEFFKAWGSTQAAEAKRLIDVCFEAGVNLFDTADVYSRKIGRSAWQGAQGQTRPGTDLDQGNLPFWRRAKRCGLVALPSASVAGGESAAAGDGLRGHLPSARV